MKLAFEHSPSIVPELIADDRRAALFRETATERIERWALGIGWALKPERIGGLPALGRLWLANLIAPDLWPARSGTHAQCRRLVRHGARPVGCDIGGGL